MSAYLYALRSPSSGRRISVRKPDGTKQDVIAGSMSFVCKPYRGGEPRYITALFGKLAKSWENWARTEFAVITNSAQRSDIKIGDSVVMWDGKCAPLSVLDDPDFGGSEPFGVVESVYGGDFRTASVSKTYVEMLTNADETYKQSGYASSAEYHHDRAYQKALELARERLAPVMKPTKAESLLEAVFNAYQDSK